MSRKKEKKRKKSGALGNILLFLVVLIVASLVFTVLDLITDPDGTGIGKGSIVNEAGDEKLSKDMTPIALDENSELYSAFTAKDRVNILCLGVNGSMTDTIMVVSYDLDDQKLDIISVPRDTFYNRKDTKYNSDYKINSIYRSTKSISRVAEAVSDVLEGMPIHYYAMIGFDGVRNIMREVGGVEVNIPFHMKYEDTTEGEYLYIDIPEGDQIIDSTNVVEFLRFRKSNFEGYKSYSGGDVQRTKVQKDFVQKAISKCLKDGTLKNVVKAALSNVKSDIDYATAIKLATKAMGGLSSENISLTTISGAGKTLADYGNLSFYQVDKEKLHSQLVEIFSVQSN